jgi:histidyl-tRNA synthetase
MCQARTPDTTALASKESMKADKKLIKPAPPRGMRDHLPEQLRPRLQVVNKMCRIFELYGFQPLETPAMERLEILTGKYGDEGDKLIYRVLKRGDDLKRTLEEVLLLNQGSESGPVGLTDKISDAASDLGLRYDLTVSLARVVAQYVNELPKPFKRYQIAPVWRADRPQRGRYREFIQCDVDIVGTDSVVADAEIILLVIDIFQELDFPGFEVLINHRGLLKALSNACGNTPDQFNSFCTALDKLDKIGKDGVSMDMEKRGLATARLDRLRELADQRCYIENEDQLNQLFQNIRIFLGCDDDSLHQLEELFKLLKNLGIPDNTVRFDQALARGLDYYTGPVFEVVGSDPTIGSLCGGGRYDELVGMFSKQSIPAVGTSFGLERIVEILTDKGVLNVETVSVVVEIIDLLNNDMGAAFCGRIMRILKQNGISCELGYDRGNKTGKQIKNADRKNIPFIIIVGEDEVNQRYIDIKEIIVTAKRLSDGEQRRVGLLEFVKWVKGIE